MTIIIIIIIEIDYDWTFVLYANATVALQLTPVAFTALYAKESRVGQQGTMLLTLYCMNYFTILASKCTRPRV